MSTIFLVTGNVLSIQSFCESDRPSTLKIGIASNELIISQHIAGPIVAEASNVLVLSQDARSRGLHAYASNFLDLHQELTRPINIEVSNLLTLTHSARTVFHEIVSQTLHFTQSARGWRGLEQHLGLTHTLTVSVVKALSVTDVLELSQGVSVYKENNSYAINVDVAVDQVSYDPNLVQIPPLPVTHTAVIVYGFGSTVTLCIPEFGDKDSIEHQRINRRSRAGDLIIYHDRVWPKKETLDFKFTKLDAQTSQNLLRFLYKTTGRKINLVDHEGTKWFGFIMNPNAEVIQTGRDCKAFEINLVFQGVQI